MIKELGHGWRLGAGVYICHGISFSFLFVTMVCSSCNHPSGRDFRALIGCLGQWGHRVLRAKLRGIFPITRIPTGAASSQF